MRYALLLTAALSGCGVEVPDDPPDCNSRCGVRLYGSTDCAGFQRAEDRTLAAFQVHVSLSDGRVFNSTDFCRGLRGWSLIVTHDLFPTIKGVTEPWNRSMAIVTDQWGNSAYAHEMAHAAQWVVSRHSDPSHESFRIEGYNAAIEELSR